MSTVCADLSATHDNVSVLADFTLTINMRDLDETMTYSVCKQCALHVIEYNDGETVHTYTLHRLEESLEREYVAYAARKRLESRITDSDVRAEIERERNAQ